MEYSQNGEGVIQLNQSEEYKKITWKEITNGTKSSLVHIFMYVSMRQSTGPRIIMIQIAKELLWKYCDNMDNNLAYEKGPELITKLLISQICL